MSGQSKNWMFTINNPTSELDFKEKEGEAPVVEYAVWQMENGENGTNHYQGYIEFFKKQRLTTIKNLLDGQFEQAHLEFRRGTQAEAINYCSKKDTRVEGPFTFGKFIPKSSGTRSDLLSLKYTLDGGGMLSDVYTNHFVEFIRYSRSIEKGIEIVQSLKRINDGTTSKPDVRVYYGAPGTGKTLSAVTEFPKIYRKSFGKWFDGYNYEENLLIDDYNGWIEWVDLLNICDAYGCRVEVKGGSIQTKFKTVILTSNYFPSAWHDSSRFPFEALARRITQWCYFRPNGNNNVVKPEVYKTYEEFRTAVYGTFH